jgi:hypothetical protein
VLFAWEHFYIKHRNYRFSYSLNMSSSGTESDSSDSSDVDFEDYGDFGYQLEPEYTEEELRQMEEAASAQRREIENNPRQNDTNLSIH